MIFYIALDEQGHKQLRATQADAKAINRNFEKIDIPTEKAGLMDFVQGLYAHIDELSDQIVEGGEGLPDSVATGAGDSFVRNHTPFPDEREDYVTKSLRFEDEFEKMSLGLQLHFAARAMENARDQLPREKPE